MKLVDNEMLAIAARDLSINLPALVAATSIWASPEVVKALRDFHPDAAFYPNVRRFKRTRDELRRQVLTDGTTLDDNTVANRIAKQAMGVFGRASGFSVCHIWPETCYDVRYHTSLANLVLLPQALAALSDHNAEVIHTLQYRAYELYGWHPKEKDAPEKPLSYPTNWRTPEPPPSSFLKSIAKKATISATVQTLL